MGRSNPVTTTGGVAGTSYSVNSNNNPDNTQRIKNADDWTPTTPTTQHVRNGSSLDNAVKSGGSGASAALFGTPNAPAAAQAPELPRTTQNSINQLFGAGGSPAQTARQNLATAVDNLKLSAQDVPELLAALRAVTPDANAAIKALSALMANGDGLLKPLLFQRMGASGQPLAGKPAAKPDPAVLGTAYALRRTLAESATGMDTLSRLQGLTQPPLQPNATVATTLSHRAHEHKVENYMLMLRAESALLNSGLKVSSPRTTESISIAIKSNVNLLYSDNLGKGNVKGRDAKGATVASAAFTENPMTLASQAFLYADRKVRGSPKTDKSDLEQFKPAYVALRNGFTESGEGSDFNKMITRLAKFPTYVERASADKGGWIQQFKTNLKNAMTAKNKSPLDAMMQTGLLGIDLSTVKGQYRADFTKALDKAHDMRVKQVGLHRGSGDEILKKIEGWKANLEKSQNPFSPEPDGTKPDKLLALKQWVGDGLLGATPDKEMNRLLASLEGTGPLNDWVDLKERYDKAGVKDREALLREAMVIMAGSVDIAEFSDVRSQEVRFTGGASPAGVAVGPYVMGVTPVGEIGVQHSRAAVLRAGVASNGGVLFLGTDEKLGGSLGGGVRAGAVFPGAGNVRAQAMVRGAGSHGTGEGVMIRTRKNGSEFETVALNAPEAPQRANDAKRAGDWKLMGTEVVDTLFDIAKNTNGASITPTKMWQKTVERLGDYRDVSFGWSKSSATTASATAQVEARVAGGTAEAGIYARVTASGGVGATYKSSDLSSGGAISVGQGSRSVTTQVTAGAGFSVPNAVPSSSPQGSALLPPAFQGVRESEFPIAGGKGFVRLTSDNGVVQPLVSFKEQQITNLANFNAAVNADKDKWLAAMSPKVGEKFPTQALAQAEGERALNEFLVDINRQGDKPNRVFVERNSLKSESAAAITRYQGELQKLKAAQANDEQAEQTPSAELARDAALLENKIVSTVNDPESWQPFRLFSNDVATKTITNSLLPGTSLTKGSPSPGYSQNTSQQALAGSFPMKGGYSSTGGRDLVVANAIQNQAETNVTPASPMPKAQPIIPKVLTNFTPSADVNSNKPEINYWPNGTLKDKRDLHRPNEIPKEPSAKKGQPL
jgi:hypothetical protein